jgi:hypothetical protein
MHCTRGNAEMAVLYFFVAVLKSGTWHNKFPNLKGHSHENDFVMTSVKNEANTTFPACTLTLFSP